MLHPNLEYDEQLYVMHVYSLWCELGRSLEVVYPKDGISPMRCTYMKMSLILSSFRSYEKEMKDEDIIYPGLQDSNGLLLSK